jgi:hypothetical protein
MKTLVVFFTDWSYLRLLVEKLTAGRRNSEEQQKIAPGTSNHDKARPVHRQISSGRRFG